MANYVETSNDYNVRYEGCYGVKDGKIIYANGFYEGPGGMIMRCFILEVAQNNKNKDGILSSKSAYQNNHTDIPIKFDNDMFPIPKMGYINHDTYCLFYERRHKKSSPSRYRRGLREDHVSISNISLYEADMLGLTTFRKDHSRQVFDEAAYSLFFPKFFTPEEALKSITSGERLSAAISPTLAIKADYTQKSIVLLKNLWKIGDYSKKEGRFLLRTSIFNKSLDEFKVNYLD